MPGKFSIFNLLRNQCLKRRAAKVAASPLFDSDWYLNIYPDVRQAGIDPALHYVSIGAAEGRWPNRLFDPAWMKRKDELTRVRKSPLEHYLALSAPERPSTHPLVDPDWYRQRYSDQLGLGQDVLEHFLAYGMARELSPHPLFDTSWYLDRYPDVRKAGVNPLCHYLEFGVIEGRDPNPYFDTEWYGREHLDAGGEAPNPLVHYAVTGGRDRLAVRPPPATPMWWDSLQSAIPGRQSVCLERNATWLALQRRHKQCAGITVIIPVHNAASAVRECLQAVASHTPASVEVMVIDDGSTAPEIAPILREFSGNRQFRLERNESNLGYTRTINLGLELAGTHDVVLLNSDTIVGSGWLARLAVAAYRQENVATVTAVSNNAGAFSAPEINRENPLPDGVDPMRMALAVAQTAGLEYPAAPTGNGFCMYVRRACLDEVGRFDEKSFPRGYGEENDFCMRAGKMGWQNLVDASTWVFHRRSASFGQQRESLVANASSVLQKRYPDYGALVGEFLDSATLTRAHERIRQIHQAVAGQAAGVKPRVLYVLGALHEPGGTTQTNRDLMNAIGSAVETWLLRSDGKRVELLSYRCGEVVLMEQLLLSEPIEAFPHTSQEYDSVMAEWIHTYAFDLIHIRHLAHHGLGLVSVAQQMFVPVVFSFHDYYTVCPTVKLLDENLRFCAGFCTESRGHCTPELWPDEEVPELKHAAVQEWKRILCSTLQECDALVTTSPSAREIILQNYPSLSGRPFRIIPHGRDFGFFEQLAPEIEPEEPIRILVPGNLTVSKGVGLVAELAQHGSGFEIHVLGSWLGGDVPQHIIVHGRYDRHEFCDRIREIRPHAGAILSLWPETWCHTLTELWAAGVPVIGCDIGAVGERVRAHGGGWLLPLAAQRDEFIALARRLRQQPAEHSAGLAEVRDWQKDTGMQESCAAMAEQYLALYARQAPIFAGEFPEA